MGQILDKVSEFNGFFTNFTNGSNKSFDFSHLRDLGDFCHSCLLHRKDEFESSIAFYLYSYVNSFFYNFGGDTPYDNDLQFAKQKFFEQLILNLRDLEKSLLRNKSKSIIESLNLMTNTYYDQMKLLNEKFK